MPFSAGGLSPTVEVTAPAVAHAHAARPVSATSGAARRPLTRRSLRRVRPSVPVATCPTGVALPNGELDDHGFRLTVRSIASREYRLIASRSELAVSNFSAERDPVCASVRPP